MGTRCHMLAMYVVLETFLNMVADYPAAYEGQPGFEFVKTVPTVWDETKVLDAKVGEYVIIARKKDNEWFIGAITNRQSREISVSLSLLEAGEYMADIYTDAADVEKNPNHLNKQGRVVKNTDTIKINLAGGGGAALHIKHK